MNYTLEKNRSYKADIKNFKLIKLKNRELNFNNFENVNFGTFFEINLPNLNF